MGSRKNKTLAIVFVILFLGYYQKWLYALIYETISGSVDLDPAIPMILNGLDKMKKVGGAEESEDEKAASSLQLEREGVGAPILSVSVAFTKTEAKVQSMADNLTWRIQNEIDAIQNRFLLNEGCKGHKILCGPSIDCGLGCQIHSMMSCLMVAFVTNRTLIPDFRNWPYTVPWTDVLQPINNQECPVDNNTSVVRWDKPGFSLVQSGHPIKSYKPGLPVPMSIGQDLKKLPTDRLIWWIGQFAKYVLRLQSWEEELMQKFKSGLKLQSITTVGIIVRKRDKRGEKRKLEAHSIDKYMGVAKKYFSRLEESQDNVTRRIYLSTDDRNVFKLVRKRYPPPRYEILGFQRQTEFEDIIKDIYMLTECDFVVCSYSSDICRLVLELRESKDLNSFLRVKSIGYRYFFATSGFNKLRYLLRDR